MNCRIVLLDLISLFLVLGLVMAASAQTRTVGVSVGNKFRYGVIASWSSDDPNATAPAYVVDFKNTEWFEISITAISGTNITANMTRHFWNGTEETTDDAWVDVDTGSGSLTSFLISANLTAGDWLYNSTLYGTRIINQTLPRTYLGGVRDANNMNTTSSTETANMTYRLYWDKLTGVLVDQFVENTYQTGTYVSSWSVTFQIISSDLWVVPEFPTWTLPLLVLSASAIIIILRQRARVIGRRQE